MIHVVSFSGGRTSARFIETMELKRDKEGLDVRYIFMDTGAEHPKTYEFIRKVVAHFEIDLVCLRVKINPVLGGANSYTQIPLEDTGPDLQPWIDMLKKYSTPYNPGGTFCTDRMKLVPYTKYCDEKFGRKRYITYLGIRFDEPKRIWGDHKTKNLSAYKLFREEGYNDCDMSYIWRDVMEGRCLDNYSFSDGLTIAIYKRLSMTGKQRKVYMAEYCDDEKEDIISFWKSMPFDLEIEEHLGNCVFCIKKSSNKIALAAKDEPELATAFQEILTSDEVRIVEKRKTPHLEMYRENRTFSQVIQLFSDISRDDLKTRMHGSKQEVTGSCSESCELFNDEGNMEVYNGNTTTPAEEANLAQTPKWLVKALEKTLRVEFEMDVCALKETAKCEVYYSLVEGEDALILPWANVNFCNPPYDNVMPWVDKATIEAGRGNISALLIPDKPEVAYIRKSRRFADTVIHMPFRLKFLRPNGERFLDKKGQEQGPKFPVAVVLFTPWGIDLPVRDQYIDFRDIKIT